MSARRSRNVSRRRLSESLVRANGRILTRVSLAAADDSEFDQLSQAVFDVQPHAAERGHQRLDVKAFSRACREKAQQSRSERRLNERPESRLRIAGRQASSWSLPDWLLHSSGSVPKKTRLVIG